MGGNILGGNFLDGNFSGGGGFSRGEFDGLEFSRWEFSRGKTSRHVFKTSSRRLEDQQMFAGLSSQNTSSGCFWILQTFRILQMEYIIYKKAQIKCIVNALNISLVSSAVIFLTTIEYGTSSSSIDSNELFIWVFSHYIRRWLAGASSAIGCSCNR